MVGEFWERADAIFQRSLPAFSAAIEQCGAVQRRYLAGLIARNRNTAFGRRHRFAEITSAADFATRVPLQTYETLAADIETIASGVPGVLTEEEVLFMERTGGSGGGAKHIPYTRSSLASLQSAFFPFFADLLRRRPGIKAGRAYFAISPAGRDVASAVGVLPLGNHDDAAYFGGASEPLRDVSVVPGIVAAIADIDAWKVLTARLLLAADDISFLSIWSPTFLIELVQTMQRHRSAIAEAIAEGSVGGDLPDPVLSALGRLRPDERRARLVLDALGEDWIAPERLWPRLDTINCWMDASSAGFAKDLQAIFPDAYLHPKGLLSTEAVVTLPFGDGAPLLAVKSGFFEFLDESGNVRLADEVEDGVEYRVIVSNDCGLYRYDTGDVVRIAGFGGTAPRMNFRGRAGLFTDLCGEKLSEAFVLRCFAEIGLAAGLAFLVPKVAPHPHYALMLDRTVGSREEAEALSAKVDGVLRRNPQYDYARNLGQLSPITWQTLDDAFAEYRQYASTQGRLYGSLKPPVLVKSFEPTPRS